MPEPPTAPKPTHEAFYRGQTVRLRGAIELAMDAIEDGHPDHAQVMLREALDDSTKAIYAHEDVVEQLSGSNTPDEL